MLFMSYSRGNLLTVRAIAGELRRLGHRTWMDLEDLRPGERWRDAIDRALSQCSAMVYCISRLSLESAWTSEELRAAFDRGIAVLPLLIEPVPLAALPPRLQSLQFVTFDAASPGTAAREAALAIARFAGGPAETATDWSASDTQAALRVALLADSQGAATVAWQSPRWASPAAAVTPEALRELGRAAEECQAAWLHVGRHLQVPVVALVLGALASRLARERVRVVAADAATLQALQTHAGAFDLSLETA